MGITPNKLLNYHTKILQKNALKKYLKKINQKKKKNQQTILTCDLATRQKSLHGEPKPAGP
jgi:hypothetical protein